MKNKYKLLILVILIAATMFGYSQRSELSTVLNFEEMEMDKNTNTTDNSNETKIHTKTLNMPQNRDFQSSNSIYCINDCQRYCSQNNMEFRSARPKLKNQCTCECSKTVA